MGFYPVDLVRDVPDSDLHGRTDHLAAVGAMTGATPEGQSALAAAAERHRDPDHDVEPLFVRRWSPRAMTGEPLAEETYLPLFEAARWAPSSYNNQGWRFVYATRESDDWDRFLDLLAEPNQAWARDAALLVVVGSKETFDHNAEQARTHSFDAGAAWQNLALEGARRGLAVHAMQGFDYEAAHEAVEFPDDVAVEATVAVGERADPETLPDELAEREAPSDRKPLAATVSESQYQPPKN
jgi:nitroreductase